MTYYGRVKTYSNVTGSGTIAPEDGGDVLPFRQSDVRKTKREIRERQRYGYDTKMVRLGKLRAVRLEPA